MTKQIVVLALLTQAELDSLGPQFNRAYPVDKAPCSGELLHAIDLADQAIWRQRDRGNPLPQDSLIMNIFNRS